MIVAHVPFEAGWFIWRVAGSHSVMWGFLENIDESENPFPDESIENNEMRPPNEAGGRMIISCDYAGSPGLLR